MSKHDVISKVYHDMGGYGSIETTYKDVQKYNASISREDVKNWKSKNVERKTNLGGTNSFIARKAYEEFQIDLMFFSDLRDREYDGELY